MHASKGGEQHLSTSCRQHYTHTGDELTGAQTHLRTAVLSCLYVVCEMLTRPAPIAKVYNLALSS